MYTVDDIINNNKQILIIRQNYIISSVKLTTSNNGANYSIRNPLLEFPIQEIRNW